MDTVSGTQDATAVAPVEVGELVGGRYRVERMLGSGGMGVVVLATQVHLDQPVALKFTRTDLGRHHPEARARFLREARAAARLHSEHAARVLDVDLLDDGTAYIAFEYLEGADLADELERGPLPPSRAVLFTLMACHAIAEAHALGIVHRDVKPENLFLVTGPDGAPSVKVLDFGISKLLDASAEDGPITRVDAPFMGSPLSMSPEQMSSPADVDARTDVWGLGTTLYRLLTGRDAFEASTTALVCARVLREHPPSPSDLRRAVPVALGQVVLRCLQKDREDRYPDVAELAWALAPFAPEEGRRYAERISAILHPEAGDWLSAAWMHTSEMPPPAMPMDSEAPTVIDTEVVARRRPVLRAVFTSAVLLVAGLGVAGLLRDRAQGGWFSTRMGIVERQAAAPPVAPTPTAVAPEPPAPTSTPTPSAAAVAPAPPIPSAEPSTAAAEPSAPSASPVASPEPRPVVAPAPAKTPRATQPPRAAHRAVTRPKPKDTDPYPTPEAPAALPPPPEAITPPPAPTPEPSAADDWDPL